MAIYSNFLYHYLKQDVDLVSEKYKIALFTENLAALGPYNYSTYSGTDGLSYKGVEVSGPGGYDKGGKSITFSNPVYVGDGNRVEFNASATEWANANFRARYAIIYKVDENPEKTYLVACYYFGDDIIANNNTFKLNFGKQPALIISLNSASGSGGSGTCGCDTDDNLDYNSYDALKNSSLTKILKSVGVKFDDEETEEDEDELPEEASAINEDIDVMSRVGSAQLAALFGEEPPTPDPSPGPTPVDADSELSFIETNAVQNKTITETFSSLGVQIGENDVIPDNASAVDGYVDVLNSTTDSQIDAIFAKASAITVEYRYGDLTFETREYTNTEAFVLPDFLSNSEESKIEGWYRDGKRYLNLIGKPGDSVKLSRSMTLYAKIERI